MSGGASAGMQRMEVDSRTSPLGRQSPNTYPGCSLRCQTSGCPPHGRLRPAGRFHNRPSACTRPTAAALALAGLAATATLLVPSWLGKAGRPCWLSCRGHQGRR